MTTRLKTWRQYSVSLQYSNLPRLVLLFLLTGYAVAVGEENNVPINTKVENLTFTDIRFATRTLNDFGNPKVYVLAFLTNTCPLAQRYLPRLADLSDEYAPRGVQFIGINVGPGDSIMDVALHALEYNLTFPYVKDFRGDTAKRLGVKRTPEVCVLDNERILRYRGRIDDQYRLGGVKPTVSNQELRDAIEAILNGGTVPEETPGEGCAITPPPTIEPDPKLTFAQHIAPILQHRCMPCHTPSGNAPFSLTTYERVRSKARVIDAVIREGRMPPWYAHPKYGTFVNDRRLTEDEVQTVRRWIAAGCPKGEGSGEVAVEAPQGEWAFEPDVVTEATAPIALPADGFIPYKYIFLPLTFDEDTLVQCIEIKATNPRVLHHANLFYTEGGKLEFDRATNFLTGTVPGGVPAVLEDGYAFRIPKGATLGLQLHYVTTGKVEEDRPRVALRFPRVPVQKIMRYKILDNSKFVIPPGAFAHPVQAKRKMQKDAYIYAFFGHMHLRGRDMTFTAQYPDGRKEILCCMPNYSFDWQLSYICPPNTVFLPAGTVLECTAHFDNSAFNPFNPDPTREIRYGPQTVDEMMQGFVFFTLADETLNLECDPATGHVRSGILPTATVEAADAETE